MVFSYCFSRSFVFCVGSFSRFPSAMPCLRGPRGPLLRASKMMSAMLLSLGSGLKSAEATVQPAWKPPCKTKDFSPGKIDGWKMMILSRNVKWAIRFLGEVWIFVGCACIFFWEVVSMSMSIDLVSDWWFTLGRFSCVTQQPTRTNPCDPESHFCRKQQSLFSINLKSLKSK